MAVGVKTYRSWGAPVKGVNKQLPDNATSDQEIVDVNNMFIEQGMIRTRPGYVTYCSTIAGAVRKIYHYESEKIDKKIIAFNASGRGYWLSANSAYPTAYPISYAGMASATSLSGTQGGAIGDGFVTVAEFLDLSASQYSLIRTHSTTEHSPGSAMDPVLYNLSTKGDFFPILLSTADFTGAVNDKVYGKVVKNYAAHCILFNTKEGGNLYPARVRWSDLARFGKDDWDPSNYNDLVDSKGAIVNAEMLYNTMIIYKEDAIIGMTHIGGASIFRFVTNIPDEGLLAPDLMVPVGNAHYFVGNQNIYHYQGGTNLKKIGRWTDENGQEHGIWNSFMFDLSDLSSDAHSPDRLRAQMVHFREMGLVAIFIPLHSPGNPNGNWSKKAYVWNTISENWMIWYVGTAAPGEGISSSGEFEHLTGPSDMVVYLPLLGNSTGDIFSMDDDYETDDGTIIDSSFVTRKIMSEGGPDYYSTYDLMTFEAIGGSLNDTVDVNYRAEGASPWITIKTVTLTGGSRLTKYKVYFIITAQRLQFQFRNATSGHRFKIGNYSIRELVKGTH